MQERIREFSGQVVSQDEFKELLYDKLANTNIEMVKQDVLPFIYERNSHVLDIWSNDYFLQLADRIVWA